MIRLGIVSSVNLDNATAKVIIPELNNHVTRDMPILVPFTLADQSYYMPAINERVVCIMLDSDKDSGRGFILGSYYSEARKPPISKGCYIHFADGTKVEYFPDTKTMNISSSGDINIETNDNLNIKVTGNCRIQSIGDIDIQSGNCKIDTSGDINIKSSGAIQIGSDKNIRLHAPTIDLIEYDR